MRLLKTEPLGGIEFEHPVAFWVGTGAITMGALLHLPDYLSAAEMGYTMAGMPMSATMYVGMVLLCVGLLLATYGLLPRLGVSNQPRTTPDHVIKAVDDAPLTRAHWGLLTVLGIALVVDVMKPATLAFVVPGMREEYGLSTSQAASLPLVALTGTVLGSLLWGYMADRAGRRASILLASLIFVATTICGAMPAFNWNLVMCFIMGISAGGLLPIVYALMAESIPAKSRGWIVVLHGGLATAAGYLVASGLATLLEPTFGWRMLWFVNLPTGLLMLALNRWIPESPRFLSERGRFAEANRVAARFGAVLREGEIGEVARRGGGISAHAVRPTTSHVPAGMRRLFGKSYWIQTVTIGLYGLGWGVVYWGFITFLPTMLRDNNLGGDANALLFWSSLLAVPGTVLVAYLYGKWSSRRTMVLYGALTVCALLAFAFFNPSGDSQLLLFLLIALLLAGSSGVISMLSPYTAEVYPTGVRGKGSGFAAACSKAGGMFGPPLAAIVLATFSGFASLALLVAVPMTIATLVVAMKGVETRGLRLEDLQAGDEGLAELPRGSGRTAAGRPRP